MRRSLDSLNSGMCVITNKPFEDKALIIPSPESLTASKRASYANLVGVNNAC